MLCVAHWKHASRISNSICKAFFLEWKNKEQAAAEDINEKRDSGLYSNITKKQTHTYVKITNAL